MINTRDHNDHRQTFILGVPISLVDLPRATESAIYWAEGSSPRTVFVREVASLMLALEQPALMELHQHADLIVPDGTPLVWIARAKGFGREIGRVPGADLLDCVCQASLKTGQSHFFYGGKPGVAERMAENLQAKYPGLKVAGTLSPPMRDVGPDLEITGDVAQEIALIKEANPSFIWIGISSPKQEYWMTKAAPVVGHGVFFGIGAAFDFHAGTVKRAPKWMRDNGLEWLHRLASEPKRLWRRYLILGPKFAALAIGETLNTLLRRQRAPARHSH